MSTAACRCAAVTLMPPRILAVSAILPSLSSTETVVYARSPERDLVILICVCAREAI